jgi:hypothetical protein
MSEHFMHEFALKPSPKHTRTLGIRLDLPRQLYNAFLGEALARLKRWRRDPRRSAGLLTENL